MILHFSGQNIEDMQVTYLQYFPAFYTKYTMVNTGDKFSVNPLASSN